MKLTQLLIQLGLWTAPPPEAAGPAEGPAPTEAPAPPLEPVVLKLGDMRRESSAARAREQEQEIGLRVGFEAIFQAAKVPPFPDGLTLDELEAAMRDQPDGEARTRLLLVLAEKKAARDEVLRAAGKRDEALDRYEETLKARVERWAEGTRSEAQRLRVEARRLVEEAEALERRVAEVQGELADWTQRKQAEESGLERIGRLLVGKG